MYYDETIACICVQHAPKYNMLGKRLSFRLFDNARSSCYARAENHTFACNPGMMDDVFADHPPGLPEATDTRPTDL
jgi:hypothetical protein